MFTADSVEYLAFKVDKNSRHTSRKKTEAVLNPTCPENLSQLRSFPGMIKHHSKFFPDLAQKCFPFHELLKKDALWTMIPKCESSFQQLNQKLADATHLVHFHPMLPLSPAAHASQFRTGAVLSHNMPDD